MLSDKNLFTDHPDVLRGVTGVFEYLYTFYENYLLPFRYHKNGSSLGFDMDNLAKFMSL